MTARSANGTIRWGSPVEMTAGATVASESPSPTLLQRARLAAPRRRRGCSGQPIDSLETSRASQSSSISSASKTVRISAAPWVIVTAAGQRRPATPSGSTAICSGSTPIATSWRTRMLGSARCETTLVGQHPRRADRGMSGEGQLAARGEDAHAVVGALGAAFVGRRQHEARLGDVHLTGECLHLVVREAIRVGEDRERVALKRTIGEYVDLAEAIRTNHPASLGIARRTGAPGTLGPYWTRWTGDPRMATAQVVVSLPPPTVYSIFHQPAWVSPDGVRPLEP